MNMLRDILGNHFLAYFALVFCVLGLRRRDRPGDFFLESVTVVAWSLVLMVFAPKVTVEALGEFARLVLFESLTPLWIFILLLAVFQVLPDLRPLAPLGLLAAFLADPSLLSEKFLAGGSMGFNEQEGVMNIILLIVPAMYVLPGRWKDLQYVLIGLIVLFLGALPALIPAGVRLWSPTPATPPLKKALLLAVIAGLLGIWFEGQTASRPVLAFLFALSLSAGIWMVGVPAERTYTIGSEVPERG